MNGHLPGNRDFNTPAEMLARAMFMGMLVALTTGILLMIAGLVGEQPRLLLAGLGALGITWVARTWLHRSGALDSSAAAAVAMIDTAGFNEDHGRELLRLLEEWEKLEQQRGSPEFDPWALQVVRNDIRKVVESDPALTRMFDELQRAA